MSLIAADDSAATPSALTARYIVPAWTYRSIYPGLRFSGSSALGIYPINARAITSGNTQRITLAGGTSSYIRFGLPTGRSTLINLASNGAALPTALRYAIVRLR